MFGKIVIALLIIGVFIGGGIFVYKRLNPPAAVVHFHAGFVVFQDGKKLDFSDIKYMNIEPCTESAQKSGDDQKEKAHLHDEIGDVVHVHRSNAVWQDLFTNIKFPIDYSKTTVFINGKEVANFQKMLIVKNDSLVVFIGAVDKSLLSQAVTVDHIETVAKSSETCGI